MVNEKTLVIALGLLLSGSAVADSIPTPFDLATLAYRGYFRDQGIRGYGVFCQNVRSRRIEGADVVAAAIESGRLPASYADDESYARHVQWQIEGGCPRS
jgi:hypothetical protein